MAQGVVQPSPDVVFQVVEGETVLLDLAAERYFVLDDVGTRCWQLLSEHGEIEAVVGAMLDEFDVDEATLRADLDSLVEQLRESGLVVAADAPA
jgi:hypothetical protein